MRRERSVSKYKPQNIVSYQDVDSWQISPVSFTSNYAHSILCSSYLWQHPQIHERAPMRFLTGYTSIDDDDDG